MATVIDDSSFNSAAGTANTGWTNTTIQIDGQSYIVSTSYASIGVVNVYRLNDDGTLTLTDTMNYGSGTVTTTSGGDITATVLGDEGVTSLGLMGAGLTQSNIYEVDGVPTLFLTSQNGAGLSTWSIDTNGHLTFQDGLSVTGGTMREGTFYEAADGTNYYYAARASIDQISLFTYEGNTLVEVGAVASSATELDIVSSVESLSIDGTGYLVSSSLNGPSLYRINDADGSLTRVEFEAAGGVSSNSIEVIQNDEGAYYAVFSGNGMGATYLYEITPSGLTLTDTLDGKQAYFSSDGDLFGSNAIVLNDSGSGASAVYTVAADGRFELVDATPDIIGGASVSAVIAQSPDGSYYLVDGAGTLQTAELIEAAPEPITVIDDSSLNTAAGTANSGWTNTTIQIDGQSYIVSTNFASSGEVNVYRLNDDGTLTLTDAMNYNAGAGTVTTTSGGDITATILGDEGVTSLGLLGGGLSQSNIYEVDGTPTLFLTSQNGVGLSTWSIDTNGHLTFQDGLTVTNNTMREGTFYESANGTNYYYAAQPNLDQITLFTYEGNTLTQAAGAAATSPTVLDGVSSVESLSINGTGYLAASSITGPALYRINDADGSLTLVDSEVSGSTSGSNSIEVIQNDEGAYYAVFSGNGMGATYLYEITPSGLTLTDTLDGKQAYFTSDGDLFGSNAIVLRDAGSGASVVYTIAADGRFELVDAISEIQGGTSATAVIAQSPDGSYFLVDGAGTLQTVEFVCFCAGTMIETIDGEVPVETLERGDLVRTKDNGYKPIAWIGTKTLTSPGIPLAANQRPVKISAGALGGGLPEKDLYVSQQHRVLVKSKIAQRLAGSYEVLVPVKKLLEIDGIDIVDDCNEVTYVHFLFDQHEIVYSNGAETESLFTGPQALKSVSDAARQEILELFPELAAIDYQAMSCRMIMSGRMSLELARRHAKNGKPLT